MEKKQNQKLKPKPGWIYSISCSSVFPSLFSPPSGGFQQLCIFLKLIFADTVFLFIFLGIRFAFAVPHLYHSWFHSFITDLLSRTCSFPCWLFQIQEWELSTSTSLLVWAHQPLNFCFNQGAANIFSCPLISNVCPKSQGIHSHWKIK